MRSAAWNARLALGLAWVASSACGDDAATGGAAPSGGNGGVGGAAHGGSGTGAYDEGGHLGEGAGGAREGATVFLVMMENHNWADVVASDSAPFIASLLEEGAHAEQAFSPPDLHPSEPNYIWLEAGDNLGIVTDGAPTSNHRSTTHHLVTRLEEVGLTWKSYQMGISGDDCPLSASGKYAPRHNPMVYFDDVTGENDPASARCIAHVRPIEELAIDLEADDVASYNLVTPDLCSDMHDSCPPTSDRIQQGDDFLAATIPMIRASAAYARGAVIIVTWDEGEENSDGPIGLIVLGESVKVGYSNELHYDHSSTLKTMEEILGVGLLRHSADPDVLDLSDMFETFPP